VKLVTPKRDDTGCYRPSTRIKIPIPRIIRSKDKIPPDVAITSVLIPSKSVVAIRGVQAANDWTGANAAMKRKTIKKAKIKESPPFRQLS
jgi:hypothetical protein